MSAQPKHRAPGRPRLAPYAATFLPTHCSGRPRSGSCTHPHPGEPAWAPFPGLDVPVVEQRCDRKGIHGSHDVTGPAGDGRCPGVRDALPSARVTQRAAEVRSAIAGGTR